MENRRRRILLLNKSPYVLPHLSSFLIPVGDALLKVTLRSHEKEGTLLDVVHHEKWKREADGTIELPKMTVPNMQGKTKGIHTFHPVGIAKILTVILQGIDWFMVVSLHENGQEVASASGPLFQVCH